ncbi:hypothetical protein HK104_010352 [Borealophlyctis nickersoniae]|nr:hypothetical protein HK104_010352 [Borealophlyctis nickersoniae]
MVPASMQTRHAQVVYNITATLKRFPPPLSASRLKAGFPPMPPVEFLSVTKPLFLARQGRVVPQTTGTQMQVLSVSLDLEGGEGRLMMGRKRNSKDLGEQMKSKLSIRMSTGSTSPSQIFTFEAVSPREVGVNNAATLSPSPSPTPSAGGNSPNSSAPHTLKILLKLQIAKPNHVWDVRSVTCTVVERKTYILPGDGSVRRTSGVLAPDRGAGGTVGAYRPPPPPARHVVLDDVVGEPVEYIVAAGARGRDAAAAGGGGGGGGTGSLKPKRGRFSRNSHMPAASLPQQHLQQARRSLSVEESMPVNELFVMTFSVGVDTSRVTPDLELKQLQIRHVLKFEVAYSGDGSGVGSTVEVVEVPIGMNAAES